MLRGVGECLLPQACSRLSDSIFCQLPHGRGLELNHLSERKAEIIIQVKNGQACLVVSTDS